VLRSHVDGLPEHADCSFGPLHVALVDAYASSIAVRGIRAPYHDAF
jgi:hypothetical protein